MEYFAVSWVVFMLLPTSLCLFNIKLKKKDKINLWAWRFCIISYVYVLHTTQHIWQQNQAIFNHQTLWRNRVETWKRERSFESSILSWNFCSLEYFWVWTLWEIFLESGNSQLFWYIATQKIQDVDEVIINMIKLCSIF